MFPHTGPGLNPSPKRVPHVQLTLPSTDKDTLFRELRETCLPETAKAIVDDCYLGHIRFSDLQKLLEELSSGRTVEGKEGRLTTAFTAILAECFACRDVAMIDLATEYLKASPSFHAPSFLLMLQLLGSLKGGQKEYALKLSRLPDVLQSVASNRAACCNRRQGSLASVPQRHFTV